jgi:GTPase
VGFIRKLPHHLIASFRSTLEEAREADLLLNVIDASEPGWEEHRDVVQEVLDELELTHRPQLLVFNKIDRLTHQEEWGLRRRIRALESTPAVFVSAHRVESLVRLKEALKARIRSRLRRLTVSVPFADGETLATLHREGEVLAQRENGSGVEMDVRVPESLAGRLRQRPGVEILKEA